MMSPDHTVAVQLYVPEPRKAKGKVLPGQPDFGKIANKAVLQIQKAFPGIQVGVFRSSGKSVHLSGQPDAVHRTCIAILTQVEEELTPNPNGEPEQPGERHYVSEGCD